MGTKNRPSPVRLSSFFVGYSSVLAVTYMQLLRVRSLDKYGILRRSSDGNFARLASRWRFRLATAIRNSFRDHDEVAKHLRGPGRVRLCFHRVSRDVINRWADVLQWRLSPAAKLLPASNLESILSDQLAGISQSETLLGFFAVDTDIASDSRAVVAGPGAVRLRHITFEFDSHVPPLRSRRWSIVERQLLASVTDPDRHKAETSLGLWLAMRAVLRQGCSLDIR